jgi:RimJ/RimL family protein N-acetyltransferase
VNKSRNGAKGHRSWSDLPLTLVSVYRSPKISPRLLYELLEQRNPQVNISHRVMPTWEQHRKFVARRPHPAWYLIRSGEDYVGAVYLTAMNEIGVSILNRWRGFGIGPRAIRMLMRKHPRERYLANINPRNEKSIRMVQQMGFRIIQKTYELRIQRARSWRLA